MHTTLRNLTLAFVLLGLVAGCKAQQKDGTGKKGLKDYYKNYFPIGVAVNRQTFSGDEAPLLLKEFNSVTPENAMKMGPIHPRENVYNWRDADSIVNFAEKHGLRVRGHNLCWHEQAPDWMFKDARGNQVTKEVLLKRLKDHITTVVNRYKGKIYAWDVVNEAIDDDSRNFFTQLPMVPNMRRRLYREGI